MTIAQFRFHGELNVFLAPLRRERLFAHACARDASLKHAVEALGVPHTEVGALVVDGTPVDFSFRTCADLRIEVYPALGASLTSMMPMLHPPLTLPARFVADAHLGQMARYLRMLGFDVLYRNDFGDAEIAHLAATEQRIVLTRDRDLLMRKEIVHGRYLHALQGEAQTAEVLRRFKLIGQMCPQMRPQTWPRARLPTSTGRGSPIPPQMLPFTRCLNCNGVLEPMSPASATAEVPAVSRHPDAHLTRCKQCHRWYWEGSHVARMRDRIERIRRLAQE